MEIGLQATGFMFPVLSAFARWAWISQEARPSTPTASGDVLVIMCSLVQLQLPTCIT